MASSFRLGTNAPLSLSLLSLSLLFGCGSDSGPTDPLELQRAPATPAPQSPTPMNMAAPAMPMPAAPAAPAPMPMTGSGNPNEMPPGPVAVAPAPAPAGSSGGTAAPDAGGGGPGPVTPDPVPPDPVPPVAVPPAAFTPCPSAATPCRIMPLGDSITFGIGSTNGVSINNGGGYRPELFRQAVADQHNITFVGTAAPNGPNMVSGQAFPRAHQGHSGFTISGGGAGSLAGLTDAAIAASDPDIVLLMIGTNDVNGNVDVANAPNRLGVLLDQIIRDAPNAQLVVAQLVPTTNQATNTRVQAYNAAIPALVQQRAAAGKHIELVNMFQPFIANQNFATAFMNDVLHPNDTGYVVMAQTWYNAIEDLLPQP